MGHRVIVGLLVSFLASTAVGGTRRSSALFIVSGGHISCGTGTPDVTKSLLKPLLDEIEAAFSGAYASTASLLTCYGSTPETMGMITKDGGETIAYGDIEAVLRNAAELLDRHRDADVYVAGHSWGGWLGLLLVQQHPEIAFKALITLDPISPVTCNRQQIVSAWLNRISAKESAVTANVVCQKPPPDMPDYARERVRSQVAFWGNYYQLEFWSIHSGPIEQATENTRLRFPGKFNTHDAMARDAATREAVVARLVQLASE